MFNFRDTSLGVMTECLVFDSIALTFTSQNFIIEMSYSVIARSTNTYPMPPIILLASSSQTFGAHEISQILRL